VTAVAYALLALLTGVSLHVHGPRWDLALSAALAVLLTVRRPPAVAGLILITGVLVFPDPWFGFFTPVLYRNAFSRLRWPWQPVAVGGVAVVAATAQAYALDRSTLTGALIYTAVIVGNVVPMCVFAWFERRLAESRAENAELHRELLGRAREAGVHQERQRLAREIHDTLAQGLTGIVTQLRAAEHLDDDAARRHRHVAAAIDLARESLTEARRSVDALRPEPLRSARLGDAIAAVAERWSARQGIPVQVTTTGTPRELRPDEEAALLRIAQEALANVARHARATRVGVTLSFLAGTTALDVRDDGVGFAAPRPGGFGLVAMRQRMTGVAGTLRVESEPGAGTGISAVVRA
jgi:signal transduction histidine kinase